MVSLRSIYRTSYRLLLAVMLVMPALAGFTQPAAAAAKKSGMLYSLTNAASGNEVVAYSQAANGQLTFQGSYATGGLGSGAGLGSQGSIITSQDKRWLFAVNAGSNQVSVFAIKSGGLALVDIVPSEGSLPISLTSNRDLLYVLNAGDAGNITGFSVAPDGKLSPIAGSTQPLSNGGAGAAPATAEIAFTPDGKVLVVTEKSTNLIDTYQVIDGVAIAPVTHPSSGMTPFGFAFNRRGYLIVSEANGGQAGLSSLSSYSVHGDEVAVISPSVGTTQTAACWVVVSKSGKVAFTTNAGSGTISSYQVGTDGSLSLIDPTAGVTGDGSSPIDMAFSNNGKYLYALAAGAHTISIFRAQANGSLASLGTVSVPAGSVGLAAR